MAMQRANAATQLPEAVRPDFSGRYIRAIFVASNVRQGGHGFYSTESEWEKAKVHLLLELDLRLVENSEVQKLKLCTAQDLEGVPTEMIVESMLRLESDEKVVGFTMNEVQSPQGGISYYFVRVMVKNEEGIRSEPLSREMFPLVHSFPGHEVLLQSKAKPAAEVRALRAFRGHERDHLTGLVYQGWNSPECATGQTPMFWLELCVLTCGLYYLDVATDLQQLFLFLAEHQYEYFALSCAGMAIPVVSTVIDAMAWSESKVATPQCDKFRKIVPSKTMRIIVVVFAVLSQSHMLLLILASALIRTKHDLLLGAKQAEVAEAVVSAGLQSNYFCLILVGLESVSPEAFQGLSLSIIMSCASLAFGFATRDKIDAKVLQVPGKLDWGPTFAALFLVRAMEVASRLMALNMLHLATRTWAAFGGPVTVAVLVALAFFLFPEATKADKLAAVIAHPGQVLLGRRSMIPLRYSLYLHWLLQLVAISLQGLASTDIWLAEAKVVPWPVIVASLAGCICSTLGLCVLAHVGENQKHPVLEKAAKGQALTCTMLAAALQLPNATVPTLAAAEEISLDLQALEDPEILSKLTKAHTPLCIPASSMSHMESDLEKHWQHLTHLNVVNADFSECQFDESSKWQQEILAWHRLRVLRFREQKLGAAVLHMVSCCTELEELGFVWCGSTEPEAWRKLQGAQWPKLRVADFTWCFRRDDRKGCAEEVLRSLAQCSELQKLKFVGNFYPRTEAWDDVLKTGSWPQLQWEKCDFGRNGPSEEFLPEEAEEEVASVDHPEKPQPTIGMSSRCFTRLSRCIVRESETAQVIPSRCCTHVAMRNEDGKRLDGSLDYGGQDLDAAILPPLAQGKDMEVLYADWCRHLPASAWQSLENAQWPELKVAVFDDSFHMDSQGLEGAPALLQLLARCPRLKSIKLSFCGGIAAEAWEALRAAEWPQLKEARWEMCFESGKPASGGAGIVMELLARCQRLEKIDLSRCKGIAAEAFQLLGAADWPELRSAGFNDSFVGSNRSALPAVLQMLSRCPKVEHLNFYDCGVTEKELQKLPGGCWPHLEIQKCNGFDGEEKLKQLRRLKGADATEAASSAVIVIEDAMTQEADAEAKQPKRRKKVRSVRRRKPAETEAPNDAGDVSQIEGVCGDLEAERPIEAKEEERPEAPKKKRTSKKATRSVKKFRVRKSAPVNLMPTPADLKEQHADGEGAPSESRPNEACEKRRPMGRNCQMH